MTDNYVLCVDYGQHHVLVDTTKSSFDKVMSDLSTEFEITKSENAVLVSGNVYFVKTEYFIENYYGEKELRGFTFVYDEFPQKK